MDKVTVYENAGKDWDVYVRRCPFCGETPDITHIGNMHTRKQSVKIKCKRCRIERIDSALKLDFQWILGKALQSWNNRVQ